MHEVGRFYLFYKLQKTIERHYPLNHIIHQRELSMNVQYKGNSLNLDIDINIYDLNSDEFSLA